MLATNTTLSIDVTHEIGVNGLRAETVNLTTGAHLNADSNNNDRYIDPGYTPPRRARQVASDRRTRTRWVFSGRREH